MRICERAARDEVVLSSLIPSNALSLLTKRRLHLTLPHICYTNCIFKKFQLLCEHIISYFVCFGLSRANNIFSKSVRKLCAPFLFGMLISIQCKSQILKAATAPAQSKHQTYHHTLISCTYTQWMFSGINIFFFVCSIAAACFRCMGQNSLCVSTVYWIHCIHNELHHNTRAYFSSNDCLIHIFVNRAAFPNALRQVGRHIHVRCHRSSLLELMFILFLAFFPCILAACIENSHKLLKVTSIWIYVFWWAFSCFFLLLLSTKWIFTLPRLFGCHWQWTSLEYWIGNRWKLKFSMFLHSIGFPISINKSIKSLTVG